MIHHRRRDDIGKPLITAGTLLVLKDKQNVERNNLAEDIDPGGEVL
jgi:hypothetical protein